VIDRAHQEAERSRVRANHFAEALSLVRGLVAAWPRGREEPEYLAALNYIALSCKSCGTKLETTRRDLCPECWAAFGPVRAPRR
jgi:hypothetical protein